MQTTSSTSAPATIEVFNDSYPSRFFVHVGPLSFEVLITAHAVYSADGEETEATVDTERKMILISDRLPLGKRCLAVKAQMHALNDALHGVPYTPELAKIRRQLIFTQLSRDLNRQGGPDKLLGLRPYGE